jgi:hypothetical protein
MKYTVIIHCVYEGPEEERCEKCIIRPTISEDIEHNGENFVSGAGRETFDLYIVNDLEEAIKRYRENDTWPKTTQFTKKSFDHLQDIMIDYGALEKKVPYDKLIYNEK